MKILIIDDDPDVVEAITLSFGLQWQEAIVLSAETGAEGKAVVQRENPEVVLLDIALPDTDGFEVLHWIRSQK